MLETENPNRNKECLWCGLINRLDTDEERISEPKERSVENSKTEMQREKKNNE